jgi:HEAT repeat protein
MITKCIIHWILAVPARRTICRQASPSGLQRCILLLWILWAGGLLGCGAVCLASNETTSEAVKAALDLLKSGDPDMQTVAIMMVKELPGKEVTEALVKELPNLSAPMVVQLLSVLADRGDSASEGLLPAIISYTKAEEPSVRIAALKALGQLGDASSVTLLAEAAAKSKAEEQKAARDSLYRLRGPEVDKTILANVLSASRNVKIELIRAIGERDITAGVGTLLRTAQDPDSRVQQESFRVLKVIADENYLRALVQLLVEIENESVRREAEKTIAAVALKIEDENRRADVVLAALPKVMDIQKRCAIFNVLGKIGNDTALAAIRAALKSDSEKEQDTAVRVLSDWPNPKPINDLLTIAKTSENKVHRILALRGFVRLIGLEENQSADEKIKMYQQAMELSDNIREKRLVLSGLANVKSPAALEMAASYLQDTALQQEAEAAVIKISEGIYTDYPLQTKDVLNKIIQISKNDLLLKQAREIVKTIDEGQNI